MTKFYEVTDEKGNLLNQLTTAEYAEQLMDTIQNDELTTFGKTNYGGTLTHYMSLEGKEHVTISIIKELNSQGWNYKMAVIPGWLKPCTQNEYYDILTEMRDKASKYEF